MGTADGELMKDFGLLNLILYLSHKSEGNKHTYKVGQSLKQINIKWD